MQYVMCTCKQTDIDGPYSPQHKRRVDAFLKTLATQASTSTTKQEAEAQVPLADCNWSLLTLRDMYEAGNTLEDIEQVVPFRGGDCSRSRACCCTCTRQCYVRCVQDCLHRLHLWVQLVRASERREADTGIKTEVPLGIQLIVKQKFTSHEQLSYAVGEILNANTNSALRHYMQENGIESKDSPAKLDYAPVVAVDETTGKRLCNPETGELKILYWPETGMCPYCIPRVTVDARHLRGRRR